MCFMVPTKEPVHDVSLKVAAHWQDQSARFAASASQSSRSANESSVPLTVAVHMHVRKVPTALNTRMSTRSVANRAMGKNVVPPQDAFNLQGKVPTALNTCMSTRSVANRAMGKNVVPPQDAFNLQDPKTFSARSTC